ncbi:MFS transporter [Streptomyces gardneri]|uniref:MFS transporter n=1 Tax=Streptomyces gardneri TaxID=66892 RepID=A0A4Y3RXH2_9ACTN|nr:MFS transporter [Streptomyces gardneri]ALO07918.1 major facilitator transporter [Streptomyces venezuelae]QPK45208.1 MFS transporter [Streptomyces gardneri]WRK36524.1 MFS transporter [Streptomyces venezuelae]CUM41745.1 putative transmembrane efflux protein [Streptomyces venezuelae]GEB61507.1 MFS transporter [Streptomyces gardneri]
MSIDARDTARDTTRDTRPASPQAPAGSTGPDAPAPGKRGLILAVVAVAQLVCVLDATIANVMLPQLRGDLGLGTTGLQWVMNIYVLLFGGLMLLGGRLTDVFARRTVLVSGIALFTLGSLAAATADSGGMLLTGRGLQGIGAAILSPAALSILVTTYPEPAERAKALGIWGTVMGVGASLGTLLGGAVTDVDWRWAFLINIPIGLLLIAAAFVYVPKIVRTGARPPADVLGALTGTLGLLALVFGIVTAGTDGWTDSIALGSLAAAVVLLAVFVRVESTAKAPLLPLHLLRRRSVATGTVAQLITAGLMLPAFFMLPQYMQLGLGYSPMEVGLAYIPTCLAMLGVSGAVPVLIAKFGPRVPYVIGTVLLAVMLVLMLGAETTSGYWSLLLPVTALLGVGLVLCMMTAPVVGTQDASEQDAGTTSAILNASTEVGGALALAVTATVVGSRLAELTAQGVGTAEAFTEALQRGFLVLFVWIAANLAIGLLGFAGRPAADTAPKS